ncbi:hypothetical protein Tco_0783870 [Tanacetum coccineum]
MNVRPSAGASIRCLAWTISSDLKYGILHKGKPKLGLWYPRVSSFDLEAYSDSDYAGANLDEKSTTEEYVAAANCCGQVL